MRLATIVLAALGLSCGPAGGIELCGQIPDQGCPIGRGGTCDDRTCAALYDCIQGEWTRTESCPPLGTGGAGGAGGAGGGTGGQGATGGQGGSGGGCEVPGVDYGLEAEGCMDELQVPDCPIVAAETCDASACLTDCIDFYLCTEKGYVAVAYCDAEGQIVVTRW